MNLTNSWMNNPTFLAQSAHFFGALATIMTFFSFGGMPAAIVAAVLLTILAGIKEFVYDLKFELPKQTLADSALDFTFYMVGIVVGLILAVIKIHV